MFVDNQVVKNFGGVDKYDKFSIASTIFDVSFKGAVCSVIESQVLSSCGCCNLKGICKEIDNLVDDYIEETTVVSNTFNFNS